MLSSELARSALESAPDAIVIVNASGSIVFVNRQVATLFGYRREDVVGRNVETLLPERFRDRHAGHRERFAANGRFRPMGAGLDLFARRQDGTEFPVEISLSPIRDGERILVAAAIRDVTDRRRIEAELVAARETADRARELADRANQGKSRFLATASHDLRQPLQTLGLLNGALQRAVADPQTAGALKQQQQAINAMSRLLNALLDISKLESGAIRPEPKDFRVSSLFEDLRSEFAGLAQSKGLELRVDPSPVHVHSDPSLVEQILRNLITNAIKYTREGFVQLRCLQEGNVASVQVQDTGVGIPSAQLPLIYDEFYQVDVRTNTVRDGYGLGLSIVQRLVKLLGLVIRVSSDVGKGSTFTLELPVSTAMTSHTHSTARPRSTAPDRQGESHVLVVEDDPAVLDATRLLLEVEGYRVTTATSLVEALNSARAHADIDMLVTDYHLGNDDMGTQVITGVREILGEDLPAVLVTGDTSSAMREVGHDIRLRLASKPIDADELMSLLRTMRAT